MVMRSCFPVRKFLDQSWSTDLTVKIYNTFQLWSSSSVLRPLGLGAVSGVTHLNYFGQPLLYAKTSYPMQETPKHESPLLHLHASESGLKVHHKICRQRRKSTSIV
jgi:hypothetical protein